MLSDIYIILEEHNSEKDAWSYLDLLSEIYCFSALILFWTITFTVKL